MITSKYFNIQNIKSEDTLYMPPYLGLRLGLVNAVCMSEDNYRQYIDLFGEQPGELYRTLMNSFYSIKLTDIFDEVPYDLKNHVISLRSEHEYQTFVDNFNYTIQQFQFSTDHNFKLALDVETGADMITASEFYSTLDRADSTADFEYYQYSGIATSLLKSVSLEAAIKALDSLYRRQCNEITQVGPTIGVDPRAILQFSGTIEKKILNRVTGEISTDPTESLTLTPQTFYSEE